MLAGGFVCAVVAAAFVLAWAAFSGGESVARAAIIDQLSAKQPDPDFVQAATATLEEAGYTVDYYPSEQVTVDFYRNLPTHDYDIVLLRAHSAVPRTDLALPADVPQETLQRIMDRIGDDVLLFTAQPYDNTAYLPEQKDLRLFPVIFNGETTGDSYFAIASDFVASSMNGRFKGTTVVLMGCSSLATDRTAAALVDRGAKVVFGWSGLVSPEHTDAATERLLQYLITDKLSPSEAVEKTATELGPDPAFDSTLGMYPR